MPRLPTRGTSRSPADWKAFKAADVLVEQIGIALAAESEKLTPLRASMDETRAALEHAVEDARSALDNAAKEARRAELPPEYLCFEQAIITRRGANLLAIERAAVSEDEGLKSDLVALAALRAEAARLGGVDLPPELTRARVLAHVAVAEDRPPPHEWVQLPRAPKEGHKRAPFLCGLTGEATFPLAEKYFSFEAQVSAILDGTYRVRKLAVSAEHSAQERRRQAANEEQRRAAAQAAIAAEERAREALRADALAVKASNLRTEEAERRERAERAAAKLTAETPAGGGL